MKNKIIGIGCGSAALAIFLALIVLWSSLSKSFVKFGVVDNLISYRTAILEMDIDEKMKKSLIEDIEKIRRSVMDKNNIGFFEWIAMDTSISSILSDGVISTDEYDILQSEIEEIKRIQNIQ